MGFIVGVVIGLAVGIAIIIGFVKAENYRSKLRSDLVRETHTTVFTLAPFLILFETIRFLRFVSSLSGDLFLFPGEYGGCFREDDGGGFEEAFAC